MCLKSCRVNRPLQPERKFIKRIGYSLHGYLIRKRVVRVKKLKSASTGGHCNGHASKQNTVNSENKPRGLYFSKALFEGLIFGRAYIRRGLTTEGNLRFQIDWASLIVGSQYYLRAIFQVQAPGGLIFGGAI